LEAILLYIEQDVSAPVVDEILPCLGNKQPKVVAATLAALTAVIHNYGCKTVDPKPILKVLPKAFGHADKNVRAEATNLAVELYRWLREAAKPMFWGELKPTQQTDLEAQFEKIKAEPAPKQERLLRTQQAAAARAPPPGAEGAEEEEGEGEEEAQEIDAFDLAEPQDVLSKVPADFHDNLASSKWKERKEALEALYKVLDIPRIKEGPFDEIVRGLAKCMKDANVAVVTNAAQCIELLAKGLRRGFAKYRATVQGPIMERLKEKKVTVSDALSAALDQVFLASSLTDCLEETLEFLKHKNPQVKEGTMKFLIRCLRTTKTVPAKPEVQSIVEAGKKLLSEGSEALRSGGAEVLGTVMKIIGERAMNPHMEGLDDIRKTKIKEFYETAEVKAKDKPKPPPPAAAPRQAAPAPRKMVAKKPAGSAPVKKAAPPPSVYAQQAAPAPLEPQPTARSIPSKLGASKLGGPGLKAPMKRTLAGPGGAAPPSIASPRRALATPSSHNDEAIPAPKLGIGRGLAGRSLARPASAPRNESPEPAPAPASSLTALEKAELEELRLDKDRLLRTCDDLRQERSRLNSEVQELRNQNAQLIEDHTRDMLSVRAKETQLVRARSEVEAGEAVIAQLRREMERLKRALSSAERVSSLGSGVGSPSREFGASGGSGMDDGIYRDTGLHGSDGRRTPASSYSRDRAERPAYGQQPQEEKENGYEAGALDSRRKLRSPDLGITPGSSSGSRSPVRMERRAMPTPRERRMDGDGAGAGGQPGEMSARAAEVTKALRAKIDQMKVSRRLGELHILNES
jgi:cytoskeleton-associated protein 5